jgi:hypothetical protein
LEAKGGYPSFLLYVGCGKAVLTLPRRQLLEKSSHHGQADRRALLFGSLWSKKRVVERGVGLAENLTFAPQKTETERETTGAVSIVVAIQTMRNSSK